MKSMKKGIVFFLLFITILFFIIPTAQAADYLSLKNGYIQNHPGQAIIPFPWTPITSIKILPFNYEIPAAPGNNLSMTACRDEFEAASFIINAQKDMSGIGINIADLHNTQGDIIPAAAINVRLVKVWYQADDNDVGHNSSVLTPELLINDDTLVKVDYATKTNYLKVTTNGIEQYIDISSPTAKFPANAQIHDTLSLQPFSLKANESKQIWLTVHVPGTTPPGDYYGNITITVPSEIPVAINFNVTVLPFDLDPAPIEYALYYRGKLTSAPFVGIDSENKTETQYAIELADMKDHGVLYPTDYNGYYGSDSITNFERSIFLRNASGLPKDHIYLYDSAIQYNYQLTSNQTELNILASKLSAIKNTTNFYGFGDVYAYGYDEPNAMQVPLMRPSLTTVINSGSKTYFDTFPGSNAISLANVTSMIVLSYKLNTTDAALWRAANPNIRVFSYANPQVGVENPEIYRKNYGFTLWYAGYDGAMDYAYQHGFGHIWNDFDDVSWRDHVFAYPTSNGVIDTIQWEGWREGVDDTRYVATLIKKEGSITSAKAIVAAGISNNDNMTAIRKNVINQILLSSLPVASFTTTQLIGSAPLTVTFKDASTNSPTSWAWTFGDGGTSTVRNPVHTYTATGNYTVALDVTNAYGSNKIIKNGLISVVRFPPMKVGVFRSGGTWYQDMNNNGAWDGTPTDKTFSWGKQPGDIPISGDWNEDGISETGIFRGGTWFLDMNNNGAWDNTPTDKTFSWGKQPDDIPITGDWNGDGISETGIFRGGTWYLDMNNNGVWDSALTDKEFSWGKQPGDIPITGDWNGDSITETGIFRPGTGFYLDMNNNGAWDPTSDKNLVWDLQSDDVPVAGDWNGDRTTETGIFRNGDWYLDINNNGHWDPGTDVIYPIGQPGDKPVTGTW